jgi:hypothetical protein
MATDNGQSFKAINNSSVQSFAVNLQNKEMR